MFGLGVALINRSSSLAGLWRAPLHLLCSAPGATHRGQASTQPGRLVTSSPKLLSPLIRSDIQDSLSLSEGAKWVAAAKAGAPFKPFLHRRYPFLPSHRVSLPINFLLLVGLENPYATGHVPITRFTCHFSLTIGIKFSKAVVVLLHTLLPCFCLHFVISVGMLPFFFGRMSSKEDNKGNFSSTIVHLCSFFKTAWLNINRYTHLSYYL